MNSYSHQTSIRRVLCYLTICYLGMLNISPAYGEPWVNAGDQRTRHHLLALSDSGSINIPLNTWPVMWNDIKQELDSLDISELDESDIWSYRYLKHELRRAMREVSGSTVLYQASEYPGFSSDFSSNSREKSSSIGAVNVMTKSFAARIQGQYVREPSDNKKYRMDGSYGAMALGNWVLGAGSIDRWWGPGWQDSMILSNNARAAPGIFLQRSDSNAQAFDALKWLGPWNLSLFASRLESERTVPRAELWGGRLGFKPFRHLELAYQQTRQKNGDFQQENAIEINALESERGIGLQALDWRLHFRLFGIRAGIYQQIVERTDKETTEFESASSRRGQLNGLDLAFHAYNMQHRLSIESSDSSTSGENVFEHALYNSGYTYYGREIAYSAGSNAKVQSLSGAHYLANGHQLSWKLIKTEIEELVEPVEHAQLSYSLPISDNILANFGVWHYREEFQYAGQEIASGGFIKIEYAF